MLHHTMLLHRILLNDCFQLKNAVSDVLDFSHGKDGKIMGTLNGVSEGIHAARESSKIFDVVCKGVNFASKLVNPILVLASAARALHSEDKKSATIKETGAMIGMFGAEYLYKKFFGLGGYKPMYNNYNWSRTLSNGFKEFLSSNKYLSKLPTNKLTVLIKALGFIAVSCSAFALGSYAGKKVADNTTAKQYARKHRFDTVATQNK